MISLKSALSLVLLLATSAKVAAFDSKKCAVYVFRTHENALWHCGEKLPETDGTSLYCDHSQEDGTSPWPWASNHANDWCKFMISTVWGQDEGHYSLTPEIDYTDTPGPNVYVMETMTDWGCYMVEDGVVTESYLVDSRQGKVASDVNDQCDRVTNYFDYQNMHPHIRDIQWSGDTPDTDYTPERTAWGRCHFDEAKATNYEDELGVQYKECVPGYYCELLWTDFSLCMPDPHADHECCISWNNICQKEGDCCHGSECNKYGFCEVGLPEQFLDPPGICSHSTAEKTERKVWSRCYKFENDNGEDDCAEGYFCKGDHIYAACNIDPSAKNECCKWEWDISNPRPGDCCVGWMSHCHRYDGDGVCVESQCIPGKETEWDTNDRLCVHPPKEASFNEQLDGQECTGALCGVWGDPHIITCDNLHYDCQGVGLFTMMKNHMFNIQAHFVHISTPWGGASITSDLAIDFVKTGDAPKMQVSFPDFTKIDADDPTYPESSRKIGNCPTMFYIDNTLQDISDVEDDGYLYGDAASDYSAKLEGHVIQVKHLAGVSNGEKYFSNSVVQIEGTGPFSEWSCIITFYICLPQEEKELFEQYSVGLLGSPNGQPHDDWMGQDGQTLMIPSHDRAQASFDYCTENWCVEAVDSIMTYEENSSYNDYKCDNQDFHEFDVNKCPNSEEIVSLCADHSTPTTCQMEKCAGNDEEDPVPFVKLGDDDDEDLVETPTAEPPDYGDCANLGSGLSNSVGYYADYSPIQCIAASDKFSIGYDHSVSVLVGGNFVCKKGAGFEGRAVVMGDMTLDEMGCERMVATGHGSLIHGPLNEVCIEVGGDVSMEATFVNKKHIMWDQGNNNTACHFVYKNECTLNDEVCPRTKTDLSEQFVETNGGFEHDETLNLTRWEDEITLLRQKTQYWKTVEANGSTNKDENDSLHFRASSDNSPVQIFKIQPIDMSITAVIFHKNLHGKTILIIVEGEGVFKVPPMCFHPKDATPNQQAICDYTAFPTALTASIAWLFPTENSITMDGNAEHQGSIIKPWGDMTVKMNGHSGRLIIGGDLIMDGDFTELHNYEYHPTNRPLPLGDEMEEICKIQTPTCVEDYKHRTNETACPNNLEGAVKVIHSSIDLSLFDDASILYDIMFSEPSDGSAHTVKFKVDNIFNDYTDIYIKHVQKVGKYAMDPVCDSMPFTAGCNHDAPFIEVGCLGYEGVDPFALVNVYFASNDVDFFDFGADSGVTIDKCCKPQTYDNESGIVKVAFEIQCSCPDTSTS